MLEFQCVSPQRISVRNDAKNPRPASNNKQQVSSNSNGLVWQVNGHDSEGAEVSG